MKNSQKLFVFFIITFFLFSCNDKYQFNSNVILDDPSCLCCGDPCTSCTDFSHWEASINDSDGVIYNNQQFDLTLETNSTCKTAQDGFAVRFNKIATSYDLCNCNFWINKHRPEWDYRDYPITQTNDHDWDWIKDKNGLVYDWKFKTDIMFTPACRYKGIYDKIFPAGQWGGLYKDCGCLINKNYGEILNTVYKHVFTIDYKGDKNFRIVELFIPRLYNKMGVSVGIPNGGQIILPGNCKINGKIDITKFHPYNVMSGDEVTYLIKYTGETPIAPEALILYKNNNPYLSYEITHALGKTNDWPQKFTIGNNECTNYNTHYWLKVKWDCYFPSTQNVSLTLIYEPDHARTVHNIMNSVVTHTVTRPRL